MENYFHYIFKNPIKKIGKDRLESVKFRCLLTKKVSLSEINQSIETPNNSHFGKILKVFLGPGALVAVGYFLF